MIDATNHQLTARWTDTRDNRAPQRAAAAAKLEATRQKAVNAAIRRSRTHAIEIGSPRYVGSECHHPGHGNLRYTSGGGCVSCARIAAERVRRAKGVPAGRPRPTARHVLSSSRRALARREGLGDAVPGIRRSWGWPHYGRRMGKSETS